MEASIEALKFSALANLRRIIRRAFIREINATLVSPDHPELGASVWADVSGFGELSTIVLNVASTKTLEDAQEILLFLRNQEPDLKYNLWYLGGF